MHRKFMTKTLAVAAGAMITAGSVISGSGSIISQAAGTQTSKTPVLIKVSPETSDEETIPEDVQKKDTSSTPVLRKVEKDDAAATGNSISTNTTDKTSGTLIKKSQDISEPLVKKTDGTEASKTIGSVPSNSLAQAFRGIFDAAFYADRYPDVKREYGNNADALFKHFINNGMKEGRMINASFDPKAYIAAYPDVKNYCKNDYTKAYGHYLKYGINEGRDLTTFEKIDARNAEEEEEKEQLSANTNSSEKNNKTEKERFDVDMGYGLVASLTEDQLDSMITIVQNSLGYAAYLNGDIIASTPYYPFDMGKDEFVESVNLETGQSFTVYADEQDEEDEETQEEMEKELTENMLRYLLPWLGQERQQSAAD